MVFDGEFGGNPAFVYVLSRSHEGVSFLALICSGVLAGHIAHLRLGEVYAVADDVYKREVVPCRRFGGGDIVAWIDDSDTCAGFIV